MQYRSNVTEGKERRALRETAIVLAAFLGSVLLAGLLMAGLVGLMQWAGLLESGAALEVEALGDLGDSDVPAPTWIRNVFGRVG
jgi:hypothetical protein